MRWDEDGPVQVQAREGEKGWGASRGRIKGEHSAIHLASFPMLVLMPLSRMHRLTQHSQPTTPAAVQPLFPHHPQSSSSTPSALSPIGQRHTTPSSPVTAVIPEIEEHSPRDITASHFKREHHKRLSVPYLGRSVSEPRSLSHLAEMDKSIDSLFASHQMPGRSGSGLVKRGRPRSATAIERMSPLPGRRAELDDEDQGSDREAEAGPSTWSIFVGGRDNEGEQKDATIGPSTSVASEIDRVFREEEAQSEPARRVDARNREVVRVNLGLRGLGTVGSMGRKGRRGKGTRGRGTSG